MSATSRPTIAEMIAFSERPSIGAVKTRSAVAQHRDPIGERDDFVDAVRGVDDRNARLRQLAHDLEQRLAFRLDSAEVGSSMIRIRASSDSALAISTSCCSPTLSSAMRLCGSISMPSRFRSALAALTIRRRSTNVAEDQRLAAEKDVVGRGQFRNEIQVPDE